MTGYKCFDIAVAFGFVLYGSFQVLTNVEGNVAEPLVFGLFMLFVGMAWAIAVALNELRERISKLESKEK